MEEKQTNAGRALLEPLLRGCRKAGILLSVLAVLRAIQLVLLALVTSRVIDCAQAGLQEFLPVAIGSLVLALSIPLLQGLTNGYAGHATDRAVSVLRQTVLEMLQRKDCESVNTFHSGHLYSRLTGDCATVCERYTGLLPAVVGQAVQLIAAFAALLTIRPELSGLMLLFGIGGACAGVILRKVLKGRYLAASKAGDRLVACLQENLEHMEFNRSLEAEGETARRFAESQTLWRVARASLRKVAVSGSAVFSGAVQVGAAIVVIWGALAIRAGQLTAGELVAVLQLVNLFRSPVSGLTGLQSQFAAVDAAEERLIELWQLPEQRTAEQPPAGAKCRALLFDRVTFCYAGEDRPVFQAFSARVPLDRWTCLAGSSGRGKSTLFRLVLGLYQPQEGSVLLETDQGTYPCSEATRRFFGFVPQSPVLYAGTIRDNLLLAAPAASERELWRVLEAANCSFVRDLPDGIDTVLGEDGLGLSVGQRQRITIARALLAGKPVLLLDEVTSALDGEAERAVLTSLMDSRHAALIATHRPDVLCETNCEYLDLF